MTEPKVRLRFEYREMYEQSKDGLRVIHAVYDTWHDRMRSKASSKYAAKQIIKRIQEEVEIEE